MIDEIFQKRTRKHVRDLNIVPILDMLVTVIFFLLSSTTFIEYTKLTLPPASTVSAPSSSVVPISPKLSVLARNAGYSVRLDWQGKAPGEETENCNDENLVPKVQELLKKFTGKYPGEKTIQISMEKGVKYQTLISIMDASKDLLPDVVLLSYTESHVHE